VSTVLTPEKEDVVRTIEENARVDVAYVTMNALATIVACYGLLQNSTAVVIGAMIIATLLGPISGIALALVNGDLRLLRSAFTAEIAGVAVVLVLSLFIGSAHRDIPLTSQILARTSPNILDLMIAVAGGAAGAYAAVSPRVSVGLVGVAIATALVPPLASCGICLARGETGLAFGGFLLFVTNFVAIQIASSAVMAIHGFHFSSSTPQNGRMLIKRNAVSLLVLVALGAELTVNFAHSVGEQRFESDVRTRFAQALREYPGAYIADLRFRRERHAVIVTAVLRTPYSFTPERVAALESDLRAPPGNSLELHVRSVITKETTRSGYVNEPEETPVNTTLAPAQ
jgi:uncharacterized hydrophobic protein (TIGR00271 family)